MQFIYSLEPAAGTAALTERLTKELSGGREVVWLLSGGSNVLIAAAVMTGIPQGLVSGLTLMLLDERYGPVGHTDSNWQALHDGGFLPGEAHVLPVLQEGLDAAATAKQFDARAHEVLEGAALVIGQIGIGADGHVAGILPNSPAAHENSALVCAYESDPYSRITMTFPALRRLDAAYVFAFGDSKQQALMQLREQNRPLGEQPAQVLKEIPEVYIYNDQIGDEA